MDWTLSYVSVFFLVMFILGIPNFLLSNENTVKEILHKIIKGTVQPHEEERLKADLVANRVQTKIFGLSESTIEERYKQRKYLLLHVYQKFIQKMEDLQIKKDLIRELWYIYIPFAEWIITQYEKKQTTYVLGLNGAQGSGKTTLCEFLQIILSDGYHKNIVVFSIDDIIKSYADRREMARKVHPLFAIRGPAGTHDVQLGIDTITALKNANEKESVAIPRFDKSLQGGKGDRIPKELWPRIHGTVDIVILEGWNVGERPIAKEKLTVPLNDLERQDDQEMHWRLSVNEVLEKEYSQLFLLFDDLVMLKIPGIDVVRENRLLQEQKLRKKLAGEKKRSQNQGAMSDEEVLRFIMLYERWTLHMLQEMPERASLVFEIGKNHEFVGAYQLRQQRDTKKTCELF
jgi:D-glycerate 3-kinase